MILQNGVVQVIKSYVRQHARAEGSITAGFLHFESLFYASHAISLFDSHAPTAWGEAEEDASLTVDMELLGKSSERRLDATTRTQLHMYVLHSDIRIAPFYAEYKAWKEGMQGEAPLATLESFHDWLRRRVDDMISLHGEDSVSRDVRNILRGPLPTATAYRHLRESGRHFRVQRRDTHRRTTDSGVYCLSVQGGTDDPLCHTQELSGISWRFPFHHSQLCSLVPDGIAWLPRTRVITLPLLRMIVGFIDTTLGMFSIGTGLIVMFGSTHIR